jgi:hypothetical protein
MKSILLTLALSGFAGVASAQLGGSDLGQTTPTPGSSDVAQLLTTGDTTALPDGSINQFYDNNSSSTGYSGSSFTTGGDPGGYTMTSLTLKFGGGGNSGVPGYSGGNDMSLSGGWSISIYKLSGATDTTGTLVYQATVGAITGSGNSGADWIQITGFNLALSPNAAYAWTISNPTGGYDDLAYATGKPYAGGAICVIPPAAGVGDTTTVKYASDNDSATFDVGLTALTVPLTATDLGATAPVPGSADAAQLSDNGTTTDDSALPDPNGVLNQFYDNTTPAESGGGGYVGTTFQTGSNPGGYALNSLSIDFGGGEGAPGYSGGDDVANATPGWGGWDIQIYQLSGAGNTTATLIYNNTVGFSSTANTGGDWIQITGFYQTLLPNTEYAWTIYQPNGYDDLAYSSPALYANGAICRIQPAGGTVTYYPTENYSATFDVGLGNEGFPVVGTPTASTNSIYGLSAPVIITDTASGPGTLTLQWQLNSDLSGNLGGTWNNVFDATNATLSYSPPNVAGTYDFRLVVNNAAGQTISGPVALTILAAQAPASSTGATPATVTTYPGARLTFTDTSFVGTTPITYKWEVNTGSGYQVIPSQTNTTLDVTNVEVNSSYELVAQNSQGTVADAPAVVTLLTPPALPTSSSPQNVPYLENATGPYAYWRLQETENPQGATPPVIAYDYSGNGFDATYGDEMSDDVTGPTPPVYPGFSAGELAAQPYTALPGGNLTVPPLNFTSTNITFVCWINPSVAQNPYTGLLFYRNGNDAAGFGFNGAPNGAGMPCLGFTWDVNAAPTWGQASGLYPVVGDWSMVAYVVTPTNETTYLYYVDTTVFPYTTNYLQKTLVINNIVEPFSTTEALGADVQQTTTRTFQGNMAEAAVYQTALSQNTVQSMFLAAINSTQAPATAPVNLPTTALYSGQSYTFDGTSGGTAPITYQWQSSTAGNPGTFTNVPATQNYTGTQSALLTINNATANNALYYQVVAQNSVDTSTSGIGQIRSVVTVPSGLWTANFQLTNDTLGFTTSSSGAGPYAGPGILGGSGTQYWNAFVDTIGAFNTGTFSTATDFESDGATETGIFATLSGQNDSSLGAPVGPSNIDTLLDQFIYSPGTLTFTGVPDGTYNLAIYGIDGGFAGTQDSISVAAVNGTTNASLDNVQSAFFSPGDNSWVFSNVQTSGGTLTVSFTGSTGGGGVGAFNGAQLQLVGFAGDVSSQILSYSVSGNQLTLTWSQGVLQSATSLTGTWTDMNVSSPTVITMTLQQQFFRLRGPAN